MEENMNSDISSLRNLYIKNMNVNTKLIKKLYQLNIASSLLFGAAVEVTLTTPPLFIAGAYIAYKEGKIVYDNFKKIDQLYAENDEYDSKIEKIKVYKKESKN